MQGRHSSVRGWAEIDRFEGQRRPGKSRPYTNVMPLDAWSLCPTRKRLFDPKHMRGRILLDGSATDQAENDEQHRDAAKHRHKEPERGGGGREGAMRHGKKK